MTSVSEPHDHAEENVGIDPIAGVYVIRTSGTTTVMSWDEVQRKIKRYSIELLMDDPPPVAARTVEAYDMMVNLRAALKLRYDRTGEEAASELSGLLCGLEGRTVKALTYDGEVREFKVGLSDGWMRHHVELRPDGRVVRAEPDYERCWIKGEDY